MNVAGAALLPLLIFKAKYTNSAWIPTEALSNWRFSTSNNSWTSDFHGFEWLTTVFEPNTQPQNLCQQCLLIMDGHNNHITANFIAYCMKDAIDLLILLPHTSHLLQLFDVGVFAPFKCALTEEIDKLFRLDSGWISQVDWVSMFICVRFKTLISSNIFAGWKGAGLELFQPQKVFRELLSRQISIISPSFTPQDSSTLNFLLLDNFFPDSTQLRNINQIFKFALQKLTNLFSPVKHYGEWIACVYEITHNNITTMHKELKQKNNLFNARKKHKTNKKIAVKRKFVFTTEKVLQLVKEVEAENAAKKMRKKLRKRPI